MGAKLKSKNNLALVKKSELTGSLQALDHQQQVKDIDIIHTLKTKSLVTESQLIKAKRHQQEKGTSLILSLVKLGFLEEHQARELLLKQQSVPSMDLSGFDIPKNVLTALSKEICIKYCIIPISKAGNTIVLATNDPHNIGTKENLTRILKERIEFVRVPKRQIEEAITKYFQQDQTFAYQGVLTQLENQFLTQEDKTTVKKDDKVIFIDKVEKDDTPIMRFINMMILKAVNNRVSDIHIESYEKKLRVRFRIDGTLYEEVELPNFLAVQFISRIKVMCQMDISEKRKPQDGRFKVATQDGLQLDFRVSVIPTMFGEKCVLRLLDKSNLQVDMTKLGFESEGLQIFKENIKKPYGMILVTGPTGSGKTTTLYSALSELNQVHVNLSTVEDPVEFNLFGINQVQVNPTYEVNFASVLRSFLRQDPDIIMVGEIRDLETLEIAVKASLTGHLVLSTLHTNDAPSTLNRMIDMGAKPFMITASTNMIVAQRLIRRICPSCSSFTKMSDSDLLDLGFTKEELPDIKIMKSTGCPKCSEIGYKGRIAIFEILVMNSEIQHACLQGLSSEELKKVAIKSGMQSLRRSALNKLKEGLTSIEEVLDVTKKDED